MARAAAVDPGIVCALGSSGERKFMGLFGKRRDQYQSPALSARRNVNFLEAPDIPGLLRTRLVADLGDQRVAFWLGLQGRIVVSPEVEDLMAHMGVDDALNELEFALGLSDQLDLPTFTTASGALVQPRANWTPPVFRSDAPLSNRLRDEFGDVEQPLGSIHGILQKGLTFWTLTYTNQAIYMLSETGLQSKQIPWTNITRFRWNGYDLGIGELQPDQGVVPTLHQFFHVRYPHTWQEFLEGVESCWVQNGNCTTVSYPLGRDKFIRANLFNLHGRVCVTHLPLSERPVYEEMKVEGRNTEIDNWVQAQCADLLRTDL